MKTLIIITLFLLIPTLAISKSLFDTDFHEVKFSSENIEDDKIKKINNIKFDSLRNILNNILIKEDFKNLQKNLDEDLINIFIKNIVIENEKIINNNYSSNIKINFSKKKIINYLRSKKIPYVEFIPDEMLIIIYEQNLISKELFSKTNTHYNFLLKNNFDFYKLPNLDVNDRYLLNYTDIENKNIKKIKNFLNKYSKDEVIIVLVNDYNNIKYSIDLFLDNEIIELSPISIEKINYNTFFFNLKNIILDKWKIQNKIQNDNLSYLYCHIKFFNLLELKQIKKNIEDISVIEKISLKNITYGNNIYKITYFGNNKILFKLFELNGIKIIVDDNHCKVYLK